MFAEQAIDCLLAHSGAVLDAQLSEPLEPGDLVDCPIGDRIEAHIDCVQIFQGQQSIYPFVVEIAGLQIEPGETGEGGKVLVACVRDLQTGEFKRSEMGQTSEIDEALAVNIGTGAQSDGEEPGGQEQDGPGLRLLFLFLSEPGIQDKAM